MKSFNLLILLALLLLLLLLSISPSVNSQDHALPRPLILQYPSIAAETDVDDETRLRCGSWRIAGEANNLGAWKTVPERCAGYVTEYMTGKEYRYDLEMVAAEALAYARSLRLAGDGMDAWVFDVDETLVSNLPYYSDHGYGLEIFDGHAFNKWVDKASAPAIDSSLKLYEELLGLGFTIFLLTGRSEWQRSVTTDNMKQAGFHDWKKLILRGTDDHEKHAITYKSEKRSELIQDGYRILGNSGDQWSDLLGYSVSNRSFKLPNPMYYIS